MIRRAFSVVMFFFAVPLAVVAQGTEKLLPAGSQIVLQVDASQKTQTAYDRTVQGQMMQGETGKFLKSFYKWLVDSAESAAAEHQALDKEDVALIKDGLKLFEKIGDEGLALGIEINQAWPFDGRLVVVLPKLGTGRPNLVKLINDLRAKVQNANAPGEIKEEKIAGRTLYNVETPWINLGWWAQGDDFLLTICSAPVAEYVKLIDAGKTGLGNHPTYKKLLDLGAFPTRSRAFVDLPSLVKLADKNSPEASKTVDELGLKGLGAILTISGYDGAALRTLTEIETIGPRKGLVALLSDKKFAIADLPSLPNDLTAFSAGSGNAGQIYGNVLDVAEKIGRIYVPDQVDNVVAGIKGFEDIIGVDLRKDLFASFDNMWISYSSPSDGILGTGSVMLFKVKDEAKLRKTLNSLVSAIPQIPGVDSGIKKRTYRGVEVLELHANTPGSSNVMSFTTYKGYFALASYPQPIHGFILRMDGVLPAWKADERLAKALAPFPKEFSSVSYSDPQYAVQTVISALPPIIAIANGLTSLVPGVRPFDISSIPHPQLAARNLFPNVSISIDDGKTIRMDSRTSVGW